MSGRYQCQKGCRWPQNHRFAGKAKWHDGTWECPQEKDYGKKPVYGDDGTVIGTQPLKKPGTPAPAPTPAGTSTLTSSSRPAEILKAPPVLLKPVEQDYILDGPHVKTLWTVTLSGVYQVHVIEADWFEIAPLSREQFKLSDLAVTTIELDPRNFYARVATWICKRAGCKTLQQAQSFVATIEFGAGFGGLAVAVIMWHMKAVKNSPRLKRTREEKERKRLLKAKAIDTTGRELGTVPA